MATRSTIRCLIAIGLINYGIADYLMPALLNAEEVIDFGRKIKNVAITGNIDGHARPGDMGFCSQSKDYVDSMLLVLAEYLLEMNPVLQNTQVIAKAKTDAWPVREGFNAQFDDEREKMYDSIAVIFDEYKKLLDILAKDFSNYHPGYSNQYLNTDEVCVFSKNEVNSSTDGQHGILKDEFIVLGAFLSNMHSDHKDYGHKICGRGSSSQMYVYGFYIEALLAHLKHFIVRLFSFFSLDKYHSFVSACAYDAVHDIETIANELFANLEKGVTDTTTKILMIIPYMTDHIRSCDGTHFKEYVTHLELDGAIQGFVYIASKKLGLQCSDLPQVLHKNSKYYKPSYTDSSSAEYPKPCLGELSHCLDLYNIAKSNKLAICMELYGTKRFSWLVHDDGHSYRPCDKRNFQLLQKFSEDKHTACHCTCSDYDPESSSTHLVSLQEVEADVEKNMVVTGVRFTKKRGVLYLQIQQGVLLENGDVEDLEWKPVKDISNDIYGSRTGSATRSSSKGLIEGKDYYVIKNEKSNYLNLGGVKGGDGEVLTGVKFTISNRRLEIGILTRPFDYRTGKLDLSDTPVLRNIDDDRRKPWEGRHGKPTNWAPPLIPKEDYEMYYIVFQASDMDDYGQSTIPYFDALPVETIPPSPVAGIDVLLKTSGSFTGIISLQLKSLSYEQYIKK